MLPYFQKIGATNLYLNLRKELAASLIMITLFGAILPIVIIFLNTCLFWLICVLVYQEDDFSALFYLATITYWINVLFFGLRVLLSIFFKTIIPLSLSFLSKNLLLNSLLEVLSLDSVIYVIVLSLIIANRYPEKGKKKIFVCSNFCFYFLISFIFKAIPTFTFNH
jgi:hypothetical protein